MGDLETPQRSAERLLRTTDDEGRRKIIAKTMELARAYTKDNVLTGARIPSDEPDKRPKRSRSRSTTPPISPLTLGDMGNWELVQ